MKQYEKSVTSQWGEDGIIEEIFNRIGAANKKCVDIGCWDSIHFSNTYTLWNNKGWAALLSESDNEKRIEANKNIASHNTTVYVTDKTESIDEKVSSITSFPIHFDFLNIDIDGDDYYLWHDMVKYKPRVVCVEYNQTVPSHISIVQERGGTFGASFKALYDLGMKKGYTLVHATVTNMIFVLQEYRMFFPDFVKFPDEWICYCVIGSNGKKYLIGNEAHKDDQAYLGSKHENLITDVKVTPI